MKTGLSMRLSLLVLKRFGKSPSMLIAGVLFTSAAMAFIMPEHAVAAIMFPVVLDIARALELEPLKSKYGTQLFLALAWGSVIGGIATLLGGARNPLALALLSEYYDLEIGFFQWVVIAAPVTVVMLFVALAVLILYFGLDVTDVSKAASTLERDLLDQGAMSADEKKVGLVMLGTLLLWITMGSRLGLANIALISSVFLFSLGVMDWKDVEGYVNWGVILMYGGAIALGSALVSTGAAQWITDLFLMRVSLTSLSFILILSFLAIFLTEGISNTATVAIMLPIGFSVGDALGINPIAIVFIVALPSGLAFTLPISTPPNAIAYSSGYYEISDIVKPGLMLNMLAWIVFIIIALVYWPMIGLSLL
jgi:sodium-dependent dicarboxylate transporter 2/3/5